MRIISETTLTKFWAKHPESEQVLRTFRTLFKACKAKDFIELKSTFPRADYVPKKYTVFNIGGNEYRVVLNIHYNTQVAYVDFLGTHSEYNDWTKRNRKK